MLRKPFVRMTILPALQNGCPVFSGPMLRRAAILTADRHLENGFPYGQSSLDNEVISPLEHIKWVSMHSNGETVFAGRCFHSTAISGERIIVVVQGTTVHMLMDFWLTNRCALGSWHQQTNWRPRKIVDFAQVPVLKTPLLLLRTAANSLLIQLDIHSSENQNEH